MLGMLEETGLRDDTLVVFTSDHGFALGDNGGVGKRSLFEHDAKVPLIVRDPRHPQSHGRRTRSFFELVDLFPTTASLARADHPAPKFASWRQLQPLLDGADQSKAFASPEKVHKAWAVTQTNRCLPKPFEPYPHMLPWERFNPNDLQCQNQPVKWDTRDNRACLPVMGCKTRPLSFIRVIDVTVVFYFELARSHTSVCLLFFFVLSLLFPFHFQQRTDEQ